MDDTQSVVDKQKKLLILFQLLNKLLQIESLNSCILLKKIVADSLDVLLK